MTDEARIERLTALARKVWPGDEVEVRQRGDAVRVLPVAMPDTGMPQIVLPLAVLVHPRALDALEAALLVLSGKDEPLSKEQAKDVWSEGFEQGKLVGQRLGRGTP